VSPKRCIDILKTLASSFWHEEGAYNDSQQSCAPEEEIDAVRGTSKEDRCRESDDPINDLDTSPSASETPKAGEQEHTQFTLKARELAPALVFGL
jgi:hypothetical protein